MQRQYQTVENRDVVDERSIVEADFYAKRFKEFLFDRVFHPAQDELSTHPISMNVFSTKSNHHRESGADSKQASESKINPQVHRI